MGWDFFEEKTVSTETDIPTIEKEECRYCGKEYAPTYLPTHEKKCSENPDVVAKKKREKQEEQKLGAKIKSIEDEIEGIKKLKESHAKTVSELKEKIKELEEAIEIEKEFDEKYEELLLVISRVVASLESGNKELEELYTQKTKAWKSEPHPFQLDFNKIKRYILEHFEPIREVDGKEWSKLNTNERIKHSKYPDLQVTINRIHDTRSSYLRDYVEIINLNPLLCVTDGTVISKGLDDKTIETIKLYLEQKLRELSK